MVVLQIALILTRVVKGEQKILRRVVFQTDIGPCTAETLRQPWVHVRFVR